MVFGAIRDREVIVPDSVTFFYQNLDEILEIDSFLDWDRLREPKSGLGLEAVGFYRLGDQEMLYLRDYWELGEQPVYT